MVPAYLLYGLVSGFAAAVRSRQSLIGKRHAEEADDLVGRQPLASTQTEPLELPKASGGGFPRLWRGMGRGWWFADDRDAARA
jgi:hypothetical protein